MSRHPRSAGSCERGRDRDAARRQCSHSGAAGQRGWRLGGWRRRLGNCASRAVGTLRRCLRRAPGLSRRAARSPARRYTGRGGVAKCRARTANASSERTAYNFVRSAPPRQRCTFDAHSASVRLLASASPPATALCVCCRGSCAMLRRAVASSLAPRVRAAALPTATRAYHKNVRARAAPRALCAALAPREVPTKHGPAPFGWPSRRARCAPPAVAHAPRRRGSLASPRRWWTTTRSRATWAASTRATPTSAPAWWARPPAATS